MFWSKKQSCNVCSEKDKRIADLKEQLLHYRSLASAVSPRYSNTIALDMNHALDGAGTEQIQLSPEQVKHNSDVQQQALELLTGQYN